METTQALLALGLTVAGLGLAGALRIFAPRAEDIDFLRMGAMFLAVLAVAVGGLWLWEGRQSDRLPGAILAAGGVVGFAVLAGPASGRHRPPGPSLSE